MALKYLVSSFKIIQDPILQAYNPNFTKAISSKVASRKRHFFAAENIEEIPEVLVDVGKFKFLLINVKHPEISQGTSDCKTIVRGYRVFKYHGDLFKAVENELKEYGLYPESAGGGIIIRNTDKKIIKIYGESMKYGRADFKKVSKILRDRFPFYKIIYEREIVSSPFMI